METKEFNVSGMHCGGCEQTLAKAVGMVDGVEDVKAEHASGRVTVRFDAARAAEDDIARAIEAAGYDLVG